MINVSNPRYLNGLVFTVETKNGAAFKEKLLALIGTLWLKKVAEYENTFYYKLSYIDETMELWKGINAKAIQDTYRQLGKDFLKVTFENSSTCIISFEGIVDIREFNPKPKIIGDIKEVMQNFKIMFSDEQTTRDYKQTIVKAILDLVRKESLFSSAQINHLSFLNILNEAGMYELIKAYLIGDEISKEDSKNDFFTSKIIAYEAEIATPQEFVNAYAEKKKKPIVDLAVASDKDAKKVLRDSIKDKFLQKKKFIVLKANGKFYAQADVGCKNAWNKPVDIDKRTLLFYPVFDGSTNYYALRNLMQERHSVTLRDSGEEADMGWDPDPSLLYKTVYQGKKTIDYKKIDSTILTTKTKLALTLTMDDWTTPDEDMLKKYDDQKSHLFRLSDDISDMLKHIATVSTQFSPNTKKNCGDFLTVDNIENDLRYYLE